MRIFIDDLNIVRIESNAYIFEVKTKYENFVWFKNENGSQFFKSENDIKLHLEDKIYVNHQEYPLEIGLVTLKEAFDKKYRYDGDLGAIYTKQKTIFRVFTPLAKEVYVVINNIEYPMYFKEKGFYEAILLGDYKNQNYHYKVRLVNEFNNVFDPYAKAMNLKGPVIIDFNETIKINKISKAEISKNKSVIYEGHIRDLTVNLDVKSKGLFKGLTEYSNQIKGNVLDYIKSMGYTHLQLLPVFDFEGVDDLVKDRLYNWGYNPSFYFAVDGWYSENPNNPYDRINGFKEIVNEAHKRNISINMDVVYNHVYQFKTFPYDFLVPGYFYRHDENYKRTDSSYCGNDVETRRYMVKKLIIDSLIHFVKVFNIDGFRFDLMGLLDIDLMKTIEKKLKKIKPSIMLYGEGWKMNTVLKDEEQANMFNNKLFKNYSHFNDQFRDIVRGKMHTKELGFATGSNALNKEVIKCISGSPNIFNSPDQSINYVECHDNYTFFDRMKQSIEPNKYLQDLATHLVVISRGIPFIHAGQEFYRTKKCVENSYNSNDEINGINWDINLNSVRKLRKLIKIRKKYEFYTENKFLYNKNFKIRSNYIELILKNKVLEHKIIIKNNFDETRILLKDYRIIFNKEITKIKDKDILLKYPGVYILEKRVYD